MNENNASISLEEANILLKTPENNQIEIDQKMKLKMVLFMIKNHLMSFKEVIVTAVGTSIGKTLSASQLLTEENYADIKNIFTDLEGEDEKRPLPKVVITLAPKKKLSN